MGPSRGRSTTYTCLFQATDGAEKTVKDALAVERRRLSAHALTSQSCQQQVGTQAQWHSSYVVLNTFDLCQTHVRHERIGRVIV